MALRHPASYKDPSGFIFRAGGTLYRQVANSYAPHYDRLMVSGLYTELTAKGWLLPHTETEEQQTAFPDTYKILVPENIPFISYAAEWCFEQLKEAALLTLQIALAALNKELLLKDATPFNIQFRNGKPVFIDTLSFEIYREAEPWVAYRQFCETFLYPLLLAHYKGLEIHELFGAWPNGIPAPVTQSLLPFRSRFNLGVALHVKLPAAAYKNAGRPENKKVVFSRKKMVQLLQHLLAVTGRLTKKNRRSVWANYYAETILSKQYFEMKKNTCAEMLQPVHFETVLDLGCNDGAFAKLAATRARLVVATDADVRCVEHLFAAVKQEAPHNILPLVIDLARPTPAFGVNNTERESFLQRASCDLVLALALVHHLAFSSNMLFEQVAEMLAALGKYALVEWVPPGDEKVQQVSAGRTELLNRYTESGFLQAMEQYFHVKNVQPVAGSERKIFLFEKKKNTA